MKTIKVFSFSIKRVWEMGFGNVWDPGKIIWLHHDSTLNCDSAIYKLWIKKSPNCREVLDTWSAGFFRCPGKFLASTWTDLFSVSANKLNSVLFRLPSMNRVISSLSPKASVTHIRECCLVTTATKCESCSVDLMCTCWFSTKHWTTHSLLLTTIFVNAVATPPLIPQILE